MNKDFIKNPVEAYEQLKAENERLKKIEVKLENYKRFYAETHAKLDEIDFVKDYYKYKSCLKEIKEIAENKRGEDCYLKLQQILQKISDCEVEE